MIFCSPPAVTRLPRSGFFQRGLRAPGHPRPRVINVDGNRSYPKVVAELKTAGKLGRRCRCRTCPYLNNIVEQDHRAIKRRVNASQGFRSFHGARRTIQGYEAVHMIRKGQVRGCRKEMRLGLSCSSMRRSDCGLNNSGVPLNRRSSVSQWFLQHIHLFHSRGGSQANGYDSGLVRSDS